MHMFLDILFGTQDVGRLKVLLIAGSIGVLVSGLVGNLEGDYQGKAWYVLSGLPVWWFLRSMYWSSRASHIEELIADLEDPETADRTTKEKQLKRHRESLYANNFALWEKLG